MPPAATANKKKQTPKFVERRKQPVTLKTLEPHWKKAMDDLGKKRLIELYRQMFLIRTFEQRCEQMYQQKKIGGFLHLYMGEEAVGVGILAAADKGDFVSTSYRDHGIALALGIDANSLMAELFGKVSGVSRGKGGSMHFYSKEHKLLGGHGIVGGQIPIGLGAAYTARYRKTGQLSLIFLGDGAVQQGTFHECMNIASLWNLPAIFVIENNQYGMGTSTSRSSSVQDFTLKGRGYNMEAIGVDGMNLLDCYAGVKDALNDRRKNPAPLLIEAKTYRYRGHSISDPATYRKKDEIERYQRIDPITQIRGLMAELDWMSEEQAKELDRKVRKEVVDSVNFSDESAEPDLAERDMHVFVG